MKSIALNEAVATIPDGATLMIGGFVRVGTPEGIAATGAAAVCIARFKRGSPATLLGAQILAEVVKIGVTMGLFVAAFLFYKDLAVGPLFVAYAATLIAYGLAMALT